MNDQIVFSYVKTGAENKQIQKDDKGYYLVTLGAFNCYNQNNAFYSLDGVKDLVENKSGIFNRRLKGAYLKGEAGHPNYESGMSTAEFYERNLQIEFSRISHHIRDVMFKDTNTPSGRGGNIVLVQAWIKPDGPFGEALRKDLEDPEINVAFSIRCFTKDTMIGGKTIKKVLQIVTWDWVIEPGIKLANKFDTLLGTESRDFPSITEEELAELGKHKGLSTESNVQGMIQEIIYNSHRVEKLTNCDILSNW